MKQNNKIFLKKNILKFLIFNFSFLILAGCGYKPSSTYIKNLFDETVYVEVNVDKVEPENAPFVKDEMNRLIYTRFKGRVSHDKNAEHYIKVNYGGSSFIPISRDTNGYITRYRVDIRVLFTMKTKKGILQKNVLARHEANIQASSFTSSLLRIEAIKKGLAKALDEFLAYVSVEGAKVSEDNNKSDAVK